MRLSLRVDRMEPTDNARRVAERYATAWRENDLETLLDCYAHDFTLHYFGSNPFTGDHVGKDAAVATLLEVATRAPRSLVAIERVLAGPDAAVIVAVEDLQTASGTCTIRRLLRYRVEGDAFAECWLYEENQDVIDAAWA